jgi:chromosome segregation ATPase
MANMEVLPWMQISERVKDIERITKDIIDLKARYEDVLQPIKKLTENIDRVSTDVSSLAQETRSLTHELDTLRGITSENAKQIGQLATTVGAITGELKGVAERSRKAEDSSERQEGVLTELRTKFGRFSLAVYIFWAILLLAVGALIPKLIEKIFGH